MIAGSLGLFFVIVALLAFQMRAGKDPAIGAGEPQLVASATTPRPRQVVVRRVIVTRIVEHRPARGSDARRGRRTRRPRSRRARRPGRAGRARRRRTRPADHAFVMTDLTFDCMGTEVRLIVADEATAAACREFLEDFEADLSRFRPDSELSRLNADPRVEVPASALLQRCGRGRA